MKVYISGPITDNEDYIEDFAAAEYELMKQGHLAANPAKLSSAIQRHALDDAEIEYDHEDWMRTVTVLLEKCDAIYLIKGWDESQGALQEYQAAKKLGLKVLFQE